MNIYWVFGGTAVGKKHFIHSVTSDPMIHGMPCNIQACWMEDGELDILEIVKRASESPLIMRWQWGRELMLKQITWDFPFIDHHLLCCKVMPSVQVARVIAREGELKWPERTLIREGEDVQYLVEQLSMDLKLPVRFIDTSK